MTCESLSSFGSALHTGVNIEIYHMVTLPFDIFDVNLNPPHFSLFHFMMQN